MSVNHKIRSARQHNFAVVPQVHHPRSAFKCDHGYKTTFNAGYLIPFFWDEVNPGDTFNVKLTAFIRFATLLFPLMDNMRFQTFYFYCPTRLLWSNARKFFGEQVNPGDSIAYTVPKMTSTAVTGYAEGSIFDYFGLPTKVAGFDHISLPLRMYNFVWNEYFRDENIQNSVTVNLGDTSDPASDYTLLRTNKIRDYFTSALPWTQKGSSVTLPLGTAATVKTSASNLFTGAQTALQTLDTAGNTPTASKVISLGGSGVVGQGTAGDSPTIGIYPANLYADLTNATSATINDIRYAFQIQRFLERDARGGTRYSELVQSHFGVHFPDIRYRPEYLGGSLDPLNINVVAQTTPASGGSTPLAALAGFGTAVLHDHGFTKSFVEHGYILGLLVARADINYQAGLNRKWSRSTRYDYPWPVLAHLGEQPILNKEIYTQGTAGGSADAGVFGYQERYAECRYYPNQITGLFRTNATGTLDSWHLAQDFGGLPTLGNTFLVDNPPTTRVKVNSGDPDFIMDAIVKQTVVSCLPSYSIPGFIDHF